MFFPSDWKLLALFLIPGILQFHSDLSHKYLLAWPDCFSIQFIVVIHSESLYPSVLGISLIFLM